MEEYQREAAGSGRAGERRRCSVKKVRIDSTVGRGRWRERSLLVSTPKWHLCFFLDSWWTDLTASPVTDPLSSIRTHSESVNI